MGVDTLTSRYPEFGDDCEGYDANNMAAYFSDEDECSGAASLFASAAALVAAFIAAAALF